MKLVLIAAVCMLCKSQALKEDEKRSLQCRSLTIKLCVESTLQELDDAQTRAPITTKLYTERAKVYSAVKLLRLGKRHQLLLWSAQCNPL
jgi:hypothetical protein